MWTVLFAFILLWVAIVFPVAFCCAFNKQIIAILEAYTEYIKTKTQKLQEVNRECSSLTQ